MVKPFFKDFSAPIFIENDEIKKHRLDLHTIVRVELSKQKKGQYQAAILESFDDMNDPKLELAILAEKHAFPTWFSKEALADARESSKKKESGRKDLTQIVNVTIDGEDAKDFDDAICVTKISEDHFNLKVSIADVSFYVKEGGALDIEAFERGTSIYFPGQVVPMLPEILSNDVCSLVPHQNRYTLTCEMDLDAHGRFKQIKIYPSTICSRARLTYTRVNEALFLEEKRPVKTQIQEMLEDARELFFILKKRRQDLGTLDLDVPEKKIEVDEKGNVLKIGLSERNLAHQLIEQFMVLANEAVSESIEKCDLPSIFRIHEEPSPEKIDQFFSIIEKFDIQINRPKNLDPKFFQGFLNQIENHPNEKMLRYLMLRSFKQAVYSAENLEHFGLASTSYTHFTSPIRRYPDLVVHRILRTSKFLKSPKSRYSQNQMQEIALECSEKERRANLASRDMSDMKAARFMEDKVGMEFKALVVSVKDFGFFVETDPYFVDGLVPLRTLPHDHWKLDEFGHSLLGSRSGVEFKLGQWVKVKLFEVDRLKHQLSFRFVSFI